MRTEREPYGVKWTSKDGHSTIYTHKTAREALSSVEHANRNRGIMSHWKSVSYAGRID